MINRLSVPQRFVLNFYLNVSYHVLGYRHDKSHIQLSELWRLPFVL